MNKKNIIIKQKEYSKSLDFYSAIIHSIKIIQEHEIIEIIFKDCTRKIELKEIL